MPESLEHFLSTAQKLKPDGDLGGTRDLVKERGRGRGAVAIPEGAQTYRPGTDPHGSKKKVTKKKTTKKKVTTKPPGKTADTMVIDEMAVNPPPSADEIERAKAILARAEEASPFTEGPAAPAPTDPTHPAVAESFAIDDIDEVEPPEVDEPPPLEDTVTPPHLVEHECGLPACLLQKAQIAAYLQTYGLDQKDREKVAVDFTGEEKRLFEVYSRMQRNKRVTMGHFVCALRMWRAGKAVNVKAKLDLDSMKVGV